MAKPARSDILKNLGGSTSDKCEFHYVIAIYFFVFFRFRSLLKEFAKSLAFVFVRFIRLLNFNLPTGERCLLFESKSF